MKLATAMPAPQPAGDAAQRLAEVNRLLASESAAGRHRQPRLIAISKTFAPADIRPLIAAGQRSFGENRVQEAAAKWPELKAQTPDIELHLVGQLQSNKAADVVALFDAIHSVDRPSLVAALARACSAAGRQPQLFVQVNIGDEPQKGGVAIGLLPELLAASHAAGLEISGLMAVPPADRDPAPYFALLAKLAARHDLPRLSMGMSSDYDIAARLGATDVRVGSALFGIRSVNSG
ncbi:YggS family pyridoxal phosphate-dependent enzyme [Sandaracinobacteroides hominis]|uniref:YggS family pyridoxal phosphate-dependent enzyme n=1 Tax=Sandaracinobacteroides hominis TaxID=2780086 RepID=UPI001F222A7B|nr:YggS family pyridoxal phosphate-dependent enzyme [Sandaracinobacteroides hominis]